MRQHDMHARIINQRAQQALVHAIGNREIKLRLRPLDEQLLRRLQHVRQQHFDLLPAAAGEQQDAVVSLLEAKHAPRFPLGKFRLHRIDERIADKRNLRARRLIDR